MQALGGQFKRSISHQWDDTGTIPNFLNFTVTALTCYDNNCTKICDWTLNYGINCQFGFE